nr:NDR1/HIN1-like protein 12 [Ipomoea trifida]
MVAYIIGQVHNKAKVGTEGQKGPKVETRERCIDNHLYPQAISHPFPFSHKPLPPKPAGKLKKMSGKECSIHKDRRQKAVRQFCGCVLILLFLILLTILIVWAVLQPKKPRFILQDATIYNFNVSAPNIFSTTIQVTVSSHNPNRRVGVYYDKLDAFATYHDQQITYYTVIPPVYQGHKDTNLWSPFIYGNNVPIAPFNGPDLRQDQDAGAVWITVKLNGRVKWRVGSFTSGRYHLHVTCPAYIPFGNAPKNGGIVVGNAVKYQLSRSCDVSV